MSDTITLSVIKADIGGYVGRSGSHHLILKKAGERREGLCARHTINVLVSSIPC